MCMHRIILPSLACPALQYFSTLSHKRHDFRGKKLLNIKYVWHSFLTFCLKHFSFYEQFRKTMSHMYIGLHVKYQLLVSDFIAGVHSWGCRLSRRKPWTQASGRQGRYGETCSVLHSPRVEQSKSYLHDGGCTFLRNVAKYIPNNMATYKPRLLRHLQVCFRQSFAFCLRTELRLHHSKHLFKIFLAEVTMDS